MNFGTLCKAVLLGSIAGALVACGGGGTTGTANTTTVVSGVAAKGVFKSGIVRIYEVKADGSEGDLLKETQVLDAKGNYRVDLGRTYSGALIVKAFGTYTDEATGTDVTISSTDTPLAAAVPASLVADAVANRREVVVPVTALTDVALQEARAAGGNLNDAIDSANNAISQVFAVDIIKTLPVGFDSQSLSDSRTTDDQKKYTAALAVVSGLIQAKARESTASPTADDLKNAIPQALAELSGGITVIVSGSTVTGQVESVQLTDKLNQARQDIAASPLTPSEIQSAVAGLPQLPVVATYKLRTTGAIAGNVINGIQLTIGLPAGLMLKSSSGSGETDPGVVSATGAATGATVVAHVNAASGTGALSIGLMSPTAFGTGEFATIYAIVPAGTTAPAAAAFAPVTGFKAVDATGAQINGLGVEVFQ